MKLGDYLDREKLTEAAFCERVRKYLPRGSRLNRASLNRLYRGGEDRKPARTASLQVALAIEKASNGAVLADNLPLAPKTRALLRTFRALERRADDAGRGAA